MLCKNPYEDDVEKLELITLEDMAKLLGYSNRESKEYEVLLEILYKIIFWRSHDINLNDSFMFIYPECILPGEMRIKYEKYASSGSDAAYKWIRKYADVSGIEQFVKQPIIINSDVLKDTGIRCLMMPTPRTLSASCGVCAIVNDDRLVDLIKSNSEVVYQEIYEVKNNQYIKLKHS